MRANLAGREPERLKEWDDRQLYRQILELRDAQPDFILHDGPPYANGNIHMGHTLNKVLKDIVIRYKTMRGYKAPYVPGWDCHGLPIEQQVLKKVGDKIHDMDPVELRELCHQYALEWIDIQRDQFKRLGILGDWEQPYTTVSADYEVGILTVLLQLVDKGLVRKGFKTVHWDTVFRTALAEAEIEYHEHESPSIFVAMPILDVQRYPSLCQLPEASLVIWTTTPWTMPANLGVSLHPEFPYVAVKVADGRHFVVAKGLLENFLQQCKLSEGAQVVAEFVATELDRGECKHPIFSDRTSLIMLGDHVTLEQGTGCVHTAPGHGADDFVIGKAYGLPVFCPVDAKGCYTQEYPELAGVHVFAANPRIVEILRASGALVGHRMIRHEYPYSWRSKQPIIFRATAQWFMELAEGGVRENALQAIDSAVEWIPRWGYDRIRGMVERRPEWCLSRQRHWGVPIPAIRSKATGASILDARIVRRFIDLVARHGTNVWYSEPISSFLPEGFVYEPTGECTAEDFEKEFDILDVWFDSGASHQAVLEQDPRLRYPADLYLEGSDQHRGWFQSSLLTAVGARGTAPYKAVLTHGFVLDGEGKAMSKSMGNVISPLDLIQEFGADILRLWVASLDYRNDVAISKEIIKTTADAYRSIRNTLRFQLGNLFDFNFAADAIPVEQLTPLDRWALHELALLIPAVTEAYEQYEFHKVYQLVNRFYAVTLSARYHDFCKDRLYTMRADSEDRRSAQTVIYHMFHTLNRLLAPILVFTTDEAQRYSEGDSDFSGEPIHLKDWPTAPADWYAADIAGDVEQLLALRDRVNESLEQLRGAKVIGKSIDARVVLTADPEDSLWALCQRYVTFLPELFIVSQVALQSAAGVTFSVSAAKADGVRCPRCWRWVDALVPTSSGEVCERCADALAHLNN